MNNIIYAWTVRLVLPALAAMLLVNPVSADKPSWAGDKKHEREGRERRDDRDDRRGDKRRDHDDRSRSGGDRHFSDRHKVLVRDYYAQEYRGGRCPPGLAKKHNGCMPPGQARKWQKGWPLPRDVVYYDLPPRLVVELGVPPAGHKYVRVASDILLIAVGSAMVVEGINDLGRQ